jgi:hypothetical protein
MTRRRPSAFRPMRPGTDDDRFRVAFMFSPAAFCSLKGKRGWATFGWIASIGFIPTVCYIGAAVRLARPDTWSLSATTTRESCGGPASDSRSTAPADTGPG